MNISGVKEASNNTNSYKSNVFDKRKKALNDFLMGVDTYENSDGTKKSSAASEYTKSLEDYRDYVEYRIKNGPQKFQIGAEEMSLKEWEALLKKVDTAIEDFKESTKEEIEILKEEREQMEQENDEELEALRVKSLLMDRINGIDGAPYSYLADESGIIEYKGVVFVCDNENKQLCLGDMSNPDNVLNIPLSKGGTLRVNRDNLGELASAISMFSAEDINLIMRAIAQDNKAQEMLNEIEDEKAKSIFVA